VLLLLLLPTGNETVSRPPTSRAAAGYFISPKTCLGVCPVRAGADLSCANNFRAVFPRRRRRRSSFAERC